MMTPITVSIAPEPDPKKEVAKLTLHLPGDRIAAVDLNGTSLLKISRAVPDLAQDFLSMASCIYAADKAVSRKAQEDRWTRHIQIEIPVMHPEVWGGTAHEFSACVGFLTGDVWEVSFRQAEMGLIQKRKQKRPPKYRRPSADAVCLFSGGLDSFIGAVDWLVDNPKDKLLLVGHYDRHVSGPKSDQLKLKNELNGKFSGRFELAQTQVGLFSKGADRNYRSRSLLFIALGCYFAEILGTETPVLIPENGPIALNFPLTPARRGSCSTRTVHPHFIGRLNKVLHVAGMQNPVINPYEGKTKGEMAKECRDQALLSRAYALSRSCAKANRKQYWANRNAQACGLCVPCIFRRAALHTCGLDNEPYGNQVEDLNSLGDTRADIQALIAFLRRRLTNREIAAGLLGNGSLPLSRLPDYVDLVQRMRAEVLEWLRSKGSAYLKKEVEGC